MTDAVAVARDMVDYYRGVCRGVGLNDLPFEHRLVESIAAALREREQAVWRKAARIVRLNAASSGRMSVSKLREMADNFEARATPPPRVGREGAQ